MSVTQVFQPKVQVIGEDGQKAWLSVTDYTCLTFEDAMTKIIRYCNDADEWVKHTYQIDEGLMEDVLTSIPPTMIVTQTGSFQVITEPRNVSS